MSLFPSSESCLTIPSTPCQSPSVVDLGTASRFSLDTQDRLRITKAIELERHLWVILTGLRGWLGQQTAQQVAGLWQYGEENAVKRPQSGRYGAKTMTGLGEMFPEPATGNGFKKLA